MAGSVAIDLDRQWGGGVSSMISSSKVLARANAQPWSRLLTVNLFDLQQMFFQQEVKKKKILAIY